MLEELEIALITKNRPDTVRKWLQYSLDDLNKYNISLSVYDSSTNNETKEIFDKIDRKIYHFNLEYRYYDAGKGIDDKIVESIALSGRTYIWPMGDSRVFKLNLINEKFQILTGKIDYICMYADSEKYDNSYFTNSASFFKTFFWQSTLLGGLIFRKSLFDLLENDKTREDISKRYDRNDGFTHLGIFYNQIAQKDSHGVFWNCQFTSIAYNKKSEWNKRYLEVWAENLCNLIDSLCPTYNEYKEYVIRNTWRSIRLDGWHLLLKAREEHGISLKKVREYYEEGVIQRVSKHRVRFLIVSIIPASMAHKLIILGLKLVKIKKLVK